MASTNALRRLSVYKFYANGANWHKIAVRSIMQYLSFNMLAAIFYLHPSTTDKGFYSAKEPG